MTPLLAGCIPFLLFSIFGGTFARPFHLVPSELLNSKEKQPLQTIRPYNIAHRGSTGEIPEETSAAYLRAIKEGADFIETDVLASKDGSLICFHDVILDETSDIADHKEFADRKKTYEVEGTNITGWFVVDFTLDELKALRVKQRYKFRDQQYNGKFSIVTFEEFIRIAQYAVRVVGIYPEIKSPVFINQHVKWENGKKFEDEFVETLLKYGYKDSPKILLIGDVSLTTQDTNQSLWQLTSDSYFEYIKDYVVGIAPWKDTIVPPKDNHLTSPTVLVAKAHAHGLQVHPYTFRNENQFLHSNFHQDPYKEYDYWINKIGVDGLFTDFTGTLHHYQEWTAGYSKDDKSASSMLQKIAYLIISYNGGI